MNETLLFHNIPDLDLTITDEIHAHFVHLKDFPTDHHIDMIPVLDIYHAHFSGTNHFNSTVLHRDPSTTKRV